MAVKNCKGIPVVYDKENQMISSKSLACIISHKKADKIGLGIHVDEMLPVEEAIAFAKKADTPAARKFIRWINVELLDKPSNPDYYDRVKMLLEEECRKIDQCRASGRRYRGRYTKYKVWTCLDAETCYYGYEDAEDYLDYIEGENGKEYNIAQYYMRTRGVPIMIQAGDIMPGGWVTL